jgi:hypothetical protein
MTSATQREAARTPVGVVNIPNRYRRMTCRGSRPPQTITGCSIGPHRLPPPFVSSAGPGGSPRPCAPTPRTGESSWSLRIAGQIPALCDQDLLGGPGDLRGPGAVDQRTMASLRSKISNIRQVSDERVAKAAGRSGSLFAFPQPGFTPPSRRTSTLHHPQED